MAMSRAERRRAEKLAKKKTGSGAGADPSVLLSNVGVHYKAGRFAQALKGLEQFLALQPGRADVSGMAGMIAFDLEKFDKAVKYYDRAVALDGTNAKTQFGLALAHKSQGNFESAAKAGRRAVDLSDNAAEPVRVLIELLWALGETRDIPALCQKLLALEPNNIEAAMFEGMACYHQGDADKARAIFGFDDLVEIHDLEAPDGYHDMASFNKALADYIVDHPTMAVPDESHPTYHNKDLHITRELIGPNADVDGGPVKVLEAMITARIEDYLARKSDMDHGFFKRWPAKSRLTAWGTLLKGRGNLVSHIHLDGYLGMVYYPQLPAEMHSEAADRGEDTSGFLELGHPPDDFPVKVDVDTYTIQPKEGRLVIFPGYFFHRTVPFESNDRRISIAFDVVAEA